MGCWQALGQIMLGTMVLFTVVMMRTGLALTAGPLWYRSLLSCSVSRSGHICRASMVPFTIVTLCTGLAVSWATMVLFTVVMLCIQVWPSLLGHCGTIHSLLSWSVSRSDPISWATMVPFIIVMVCTGLALTAGPLWYRSLLSWSVQVWPCLLGHYSTIHYCYGLYRSGPVCWTTVVLFVHYCHALYRSGPICWATVPFTIFMLCIHVWPTVVLFTIVMVCTGLALSARPLWYHSLLSCSLSRSGLICWATTSSRAPLRSGRHRMR